jgi:hypothetical protein
MSAYAMSDHERDASASSLGNASITSRMKSSSSTALVPRAILDLRNSPRRAARVEVWLCEFWCTGDFVGTRHRNAHGREDADEHALMVL